MIMSTPTTSNSDITIRIARNEDLEAIQGLIKAFRQEHDYPSPAWSAFPALEEEAFHILLAESKEECLGLLATQRCHNLAQGAAFLLLSDIFVLARHRQQGVAKALIIEAKRLAAEMNCQGLSLIVADVNKAALTTAARSGFTRHKELLLSFAAE